MNKQLETFSGKNLHGKYINFEVIKYTFEYAKDKVILDNINRAGHELAAKVNPAAANDGDYNRLPTRILQNSVSGMLAEYCWLIFLNEQGGREIVKTTEFTGASGQIDLLIKRTDKKIEVRSSFPRNGINFAIFNPKYQFDILGPYSNTVKPGEVQKDYYVRTLYPFDTGEFFTHFNKSIEVYLTGGATWGMMNNNNYSKEKDLVPENEIVTNNRKSRYKVVPLSLAFDTTKITQLILNDSPR